MGITYSRYIDKLYGCWLGKCVIGTLGAPYEGMKQLNHLKFERRLIEKMLPNDDLDLQVLWLKVLEERGVYVTGEDLAKAFHEENIYWPGEYAWFNKNYMRGIRPPYTGIYENEFYREGMGCPIRAEIWGLILPANPDLAAELSAIDGTLDHDGTSVYLEQFWVAMISAGFEEDDVKSLIQTGLKYLPEKSRARKMVTDVLCWCEEYEDPVYIRSRIIGVYGHSDCTYSLTNIALTLLCLLKGNGDYFETGMMACNFGFDTDCTAGNAGALLGLLYGAERLKKEYGIGECGYVLTLRYHRKTDRVYDLAKDTARVGVHFLRNYPAAVNPIDDLPADDLCPEPPAEVEIINKYSEPPYLAPGEKIQMSFEIFNRTDRKLKVYLETQAKSGFSFTTEKNFLEIPAKSKGEVLAEAECLVSDWLDEVNLMKLVARYENQSAERTFGVIGKVGYKLYGPFWQNNVDIDLGNNEKSYYAYFPATKSKEEYADVVRFYHLNMMTDIHREYLKISDILNDQTDSSLYETEGRVYWNSGDALKINDLGNFQAPCTYYLKRTMNFEKDTDLHMNIGHSDAFKIYLNGELLCERDNEENWTPENVHKLNVHFRKGENTLIYRVCKRNGDAKFSVTFLETRDSAPHFTQLNSKIIK